MEELLQRIDSRLDAMEARIEDLGLGGRRNITNFIDNIKPDIDNIRINVAQIKLKMEA